MSATMSLTAATATDDCKTLMDASSALDIREVDFFRLAFRRWFGRDMRAAELERAFAAYMFENVVPSWARHFSRVVLADAADGTLDPVRLGAIAFRRQPPPHPHGRLYVGVTLAVFLFYCAALLQISYDPQTSAPLPCHGGAGMKIAIDLAHAVSGTPPRTCPPVTAPR